MISILFLLPALGLLLSLLVDVLIMSYIQLLISLGLFLSSLYIFFHKEYSTHLYNLFFVDPVNSFLLLTVALLELFVVFYSFGYIRTEISQGMSKRRFKYYYFWKNGFIFSMILSILSNNLGVYWVGLEATTLTTAFLIAFYRSKESYEASWKYVIMCSIGITLGLFAIVLLYYSTAHIYGESLKALSFLDIMASVQKLDKDILFLSFILALVGFGTKVGFAPMHNWLPDAHSQAPSPISVLLSGVLLNTALLGVLRFYQINEKAGVGYARDFMIFFGFLTLFLASLIMLRQGEYKRLFAYSSMENMGLIALGFGVGGYGAFGAFFHILFHAIAKGVLFMTSGNILSVLHERRIEKISGLFKDMKITSFVMLLGLASISGLPPFSTFFSKIYIIIGVIQKSHFLGILVLFSLAVAFSGIFWQILPMLSGISKGEREKVLHPFMIIIPTLMLLILIALTFYTPETLTQIIKMAVNELYG